MSKENTHVLNPKLLIYTRTLNGNREIVAETDSSSPPFILNAAEAIQCIAELPERFSREHVFEIWSKCKIKKSLHETLFSEFVKERLILDILDDDYVKFQTWDKYQWSEAFIYHSSTKDYPFIQMDSEEGANEDTQRMKDYHEVSPPPTLYRNHHFEERFELKKAQDVLGDGLEIMTKKLSGLDQLSLLFDLTFGERRKVEFGEQGLFLNKSIPSGGARHPTEAYYFCFSHETLKPGLYHYNVENNSLDLVRPGNHYDKCLDITFDLFNRYKNKPHGFLVLTSVVERAMWRYRESRSWRAILMDAGIALSLFRKVSEFLNIELYSYQKFKDSELHELLEVDKYEEPALYVCTLV